MLKIKRLYLFMLQSFLPLFLMTFFICLFIVLMQFLWRYIDDLVGKGLEISVIAELFFYAALTMVPMALPLAILLASLMTFGNLGERFELMAMKASGISLIKVMKPLIILMAFVAIGAFFFQNNVLPVAQTKMYTLLWSMRQKSPELDIPEGVFYDQITGYNIFVEKKDRERGTLHNMMIYDVTRGSDINRLRIILADSGKMSISEDKTNLFLRLYDGEQFDNMQEQGTKAENASFRRESFSLKEILIPFDNNFNRMDESGMRNQYVGKDMSRLLQTIDSVQNIVDSIGNVYGREIITTPLFNIPRISINRELDSIRAIEGAKQINVDSIFKSLDPSMTKTVASQALSHSRTNRQNFEFRNYLVEDEQKTIRRHGIELMKKFTLSFACIIFFFIGAPLGAIIRKGGLGTPLVISVVLFIIYYIIDNTGYKLARDGRWEVWQGMWLSSAVLLPLGIFLTYKAINDSAILNSDSYFNFFKRLIGISQVRHVEMKEVSMEEIDNSVATEMLGALRKKCEEFTKQFNPQQSYTSFFLNGFDRQKIHIISEEIEGVVEYLTNSRNKLLVSKLSDYPILRDLWLYNPSPQKWLAWTFITIFPIGLVMWIIGKKMRGSLIAEIKTVDKNSLAIEELMLAEK